MARVSDSDACHGFINETHEIALSQPFIPVSVSVSVAPAPQDSSGIASISEQEQPVLDFAAAGKSSSPSNDNINNIAFAMEGKGKGNQQQQQQQQPLSAFAAEAQQTEKSLDSFNHKIAEQEQASADTEDSLEVKKKRLLDKLESVLLPKDKDNLILQQHDLPPLRPSLGLGIEVIDETALVETVPASGILSKKTTTVPGSKKSLAAAVKEMDVIAKNGKQSRRRARGGAKKDKDARHRAVPVAGMDEAQNENENGTKRKYSRKEMEALRFVSVGEQRKFWKAIYGALETAVAEEYDNLASTEHQKHVRLNYDPRPCLAKKKEAPPILSDVSCENMDRELQLMESSENVSPVDSSCSHSLMGEDGCSILEEGSEDDDSEDDYASIQRPAFLVEGEPNFDSGPPEDGWEYLRRVRWEACQIPKVKVAKLDRSKLNKEQSAYMPKIPDIAKSPEHLLPLKQWEDVFLAEFSALRANLSCLEGSNAQYSSNLQPVHSSQLFGKSFGESASVMNRDIVEKAIDQPANVTAEDNNTTLLPENAGSKTSIDQTTRNSPTPPLLYAILGIDSVARVSMLLKRISLLEHANTITRNDCMWLFALCATVDAPLDADSSAALRGLLRKCASIRAAKAELDEEVVMLNILATISGRYFGQSEN